MILPRQCSLVLSCCLFLIGVSHDGRVGAVTAGGDSGGGPSRAIAAERHPIRVQLQHRNTAAAQHAHASGSPTDSLESQASSFVPSLSHAEPSSSVDWSWLNAQNHDAATTASHEWEQFCATHSLSLECRYLNERSSSEDDATPSPHHAQQHAHATNAPTIRRRQSSPDSQQSTYTAQSSMQHPNAPHHTSAASAFAAAQHDAASFAHLPIHPSHQPAAAAAAQRHEDGTLLTLPFRKHYNPHSALYAHRPAINMNSAPYDHRTASHSRGSGSDRNRIASEDEKEAIWRLMHSSYGWPHEMTYDPLLSRDHVLSHESLALQDQQEEENDQHSHATAPTQSQQQQSPHVAPTGRKRVATRTVPTVNPVAERKRQTRTAAASAAAPQKRAKLNHAAVASTVAPMHRRTLRSTSSAAAAASGDATAGARAPAGGHQSSIRAQRDATASTVATQQNGQVQSQDEDLQTNLDRALADARAQRHTEEQEQQHAQRQVDVLNSPQHLEQQQRALALLSHAEHTRLASAFAAAAAADAKSQLPASSRVITTHIK